VNVHDRFRDGSGDKSNEDIFPIHFVSFTPRTAIA
jgi:hypothetical protein